MTLGLTVIGGYVVAKTIFILKGCPLKYQRIALVVAGILLSQVMFL